MEVEMESYQIAMQINGKKCAQFEFGMRFVFFFFNFCRIHALDATIKNGYWVLSARQRPDKYRIAIRMGNVYLLFQSCNPSIKILLFTQ